MLRHAFLFAALLAFSTCASAVAAAPMSAAGEYSKHFDALTKLSIAVAHAMPADQYSFRPHPDSMDFGALMSHVATTNYQFCAGLNQLLRLLLRRDQQTAASPAAKFYWRCLST